MLHSLELPVAVRYAMGNLQMMLGANFVYNLGINLREISSVLSTYTHEPPHAPEQRVLTLADFNARFGMGYLLGVGYQIAPNSTVDMRLTQTVWDNASGSGAQRVSSEFYKHPSLQVSLSYWLGKKPHPQKQDD
jgi:hypothetical protein